MNKKKLIVINKEKIFQKENNFFCDNIDMKTIPEELSKNFELSVIATKSETERLLKIDCERHELPILEGGIKTILEYKPIVIVEQHADTEYCAGNFLKSHGAKELTNVRKDYIFGW